MPERPDLDAWVPRLDRALRGLRIDAVEVRDPVVLRMLVEGGPGEVLAGRTIEGVARRGTFVVLHLSGALDVVVAPMLAGRFRLEEGAPSDTVLALTLSDGRTLRYRDDVRMGKVYLVPPHRHDAVPGLGSIGVDVLSDAFTRDRFRALARRRRDQVKVFLLDHAALDSLGNAYADEVLFEAGVHPKARVSKLDGETLDRLHDAIVTVLREAAAVVAAREAPLDHKVRDFLKVRGRKGEPCPRCGTTIRVAGVRGFDAFFCPGCQPDREGRGFVDWSRVGG